MTDAEMTAAVNQIAADPTLGEIIQGTGGCRKARLAGRGKGKSGGYRVITFYVDKDVPVYLLTVFSKGEKSNLTDSEKAQLAVVAKAVVGASRGKVTSIRA